MDDMHTDTTTESHPHNWTTASSHNTSEGTVSYQHCRCGAQRILARTSSTHVPVAVVAGR
ncbi:hypothetical protein D8W71_16035 [Rhodococcus sp. P1Y]|nr:hypothetical protein D8W71_16035 [Rhodococcus sp. P1Y]